METDASRVGMWAILSQQNHHIAFFSKPFCSKLLHASTYVRELAAITVAVKKWRQFLLGHHFTILTDHRSLKELMVQAIQTPEQQIYLARLLGYDYIIQYRTGKSNLTVDALSRRLENSPREFFVLTTPNYIFLQELKANLLTNQELLGYWQKIKDEPHNHLDYVLRHDLILQKGCIWLPHGAHSIPTNLAEFHSMPTGGHMGIMKTLALVGENFVWATMKKDVHQYVTSYITYQQTKYNHRRQPGLLCPLPIPARPWEDLSLDFIVGSPVFWGHSVILVVVDRFLKGVHLGLLLPHYTASGMARTFIDISGKIHGMPCSLVSDRDPLLISRFWQELFKLSGTKLHMSSINSMLVCW